MIILPGTSYTSIASFVSLRSGDALGAVTNLDSSKINLIFDVQQYLDSDASGTHVVCVSDDTTNFEESGNLSTYLRTSDRQAKVPSRTQIWLSRRT